MLGFRLAEWSTSNKSHAHSKKKQALVLLESEP